MDDVEKESLKEGMQLVTNRIKAVKLVLNDYVGPHPAIESDPRVAIEGAATNVDTDATSCKVTVGEGKTKTAIRM